MNRKRKQKPLGGANPGPDPGHFTTPLGEWGEVDLLRKVFNDYDGEEATKVGAPYVDIYGSLEKFGKCAYCENQMYMKKDLIFCPFCRRVLQVQAPDSEYHEPSPSNTGGAEIAHNIPLPSEVPFDAQNYPQQAPGTSRSDTY